MTHFLTRLAQRTLGLAPVVQPRLVSRYAPVDEVILDATPTLSTPSQRAIEELQVRQTSLEVNLEINNLINHQINNSTNSQISNSPSLNLTESPITDSSYVPQNDSTPPTTPVQSTAAPAYPVVNQAPLLPQQPVVVQETIAPLNERLDPPQFSPNSSLVEPSTDVSPQAVKPSEQLSQVRAAQRPLVPPTLVDLSSPPSETTIERETTIAVPLVNLQAPTLTELTAPPASVRHLTASLPQPSQPSEDTVIEVRIGRIEVRSTPASIAKPRTKSTSTTPALSLSDYLNQRDGGK
ncbi:hypothetical protein [Leptolyngbya sp. FACHB-17]|uniref:hypothetical protein n=1 Tax=unclassified Leptolyngbya TaxID=2650499 RepID=UPI0016812D1E|nr:hypothetical protein [Leptolyngbya sp. FACHB-17]MBD2080937.1 hypothetical protein [Leptolyngbya sp. FACHB-17]